MHPPASSGGTESVFVKETPKNDNEDHPNQNSFRVIAPWFYGLFAIAALASGLGASISSRRAKATQEAWERYTEQRTQEGLGSALGYDEDEGSS